jgi:hypothetical protein
VAGSVLYELDQFLRFPDAVENRLRHLEVRLLGVGPDVVDLPHVALPQN